MYGRVTSKHSCVDENGVPWEIRFYASRANLLYVNEAYKKALEAWLKATAAPNASNERKRLMDEARQLTVMALN